MIQLKDTRSQNTAALIARAVRTAEYYGFRPFEALIAKGKQPLVQTKKEDIAFARRDERLLIPSARTMLSLKRLPQEVLLSWRVIKYQGGFRTPTPCITLELHVLGAQSAIAEALLITVTNAIAEEVGVGEKSLAINSLGSHESSNRFVRDVSSFLRKHLDSISPTLRPRAATDPLGTLIQLFEKGHPAVSRAPQSVEYLTEEERRRFWDLLEYLEMSGIPYELNSSVLGSRDFWSHTLFEISAADSETGSRVPFATGGRYDPIATRFGGPDSFGAVATISVEIRGKSTYEPVKRPTPALYFAHLGPEARRRALKVMEMLRREGISVEQSLMYEKMHEQMERAKGLRVSHLLIMGHKEAMEGTVLVREVATNSQEAILLPDLPSYLRRQRVRL